MADNLSINGAARRLSCSTSAVSRRIDRAESATGLTLLYRTMRQIWLSDQGTAYLPVARRLLSEELHARRAAQELNRNAPTAAAAPGHRPLL